MITNESLFEHFTRTRRSGRRTAWGIPARYVPRSVRIGVATGDYAPDTAEPLTEADLEPSHAIVVCPECCHADYVDMFLPGEQLCGDCVLQRWSDEQDTLKAIVRQEHALLGQ